MRVKKLTYAVVFFLVIPFFVHGEGARFNDLFKDSEFGESAAEIDPDFVVDIDATQNQIIRRYTLDVETYSRKILQAQRKLPFTRRHQDKPWWLIGEIQY